MYCPPQIEIIGEVIDVTLFGGSVGDQEDP